MSTPEGNFEIAVDESNEPQAREEAIDQLETANDCDRLVQLARADDLDERFRERALTGLASPQCKLRLQDLLEEGDLPSSLAERAETLLDETPDDAGAGP